MAEDAFGIVGTVIASAYHVESVVAEGGFGTVYRAHHGGFRAPVALKCLRLPPGLLPEGRQHFLDSFRAEAELLFRLSASIPSVVRPLHVDVFTTADGRFVPYLVLEWLDGHTLDALIRRRLAEGQPPLPLKKLIRLLTPVARALERAHNFRGPDGAVSIVHRDVKPENIFVANVAGDEVVKILDFGIGKAKSMVSQVAGRASQGTGGIATFTPAYGAPEQWAPKQFGQTGPWTDVWGLSLTLTEGLLGHPVFDGDAASIMAAVLDPARRPTPGNEGVVVTPEVERVFARALALDPRDRYADAGVFWNELLAAARITSGEMQEVRMPRDARAEPGGGTLVERVERVELRRGSGRPQSASVPPPVSSAARPFDAPAGAAAQVLRPLSASPSPALFPPSVSGSFEVPDLDVAPVSRPGTPRTSSGTRPAVAPPIHLDDAPLELLPSAPLELDLPSNDPLIRRVSTGGMPAVHPSEPPGSLRLPPVRASDPPIALARSSSPPPVAVTASVPRVGSVPPRARASVPPAPQPVALPARVKPAFRLTLAADAGASLGVRLLPGGLVLGAAVLLTILDQMYSTISGQVFTHFGLRTSVLAGLLMIAGIGLCLYRLKRD